MGDNLKKLENRPQNLQGHSLFQIAPRPQKGWIRAVRESAGISAGELGRILGVSRQLPLQFEKAEADDTITLKSLRNVANALGCDLVYALVPKPGRVPDEIADREQVRKRKHRPIKFVVRGDQAVEKARETTEAKATTAEAENMDPYFCD